MIHASCLAWSATATDAEQLSSAITVRVANRAGVPQATIVKMQSEAEWVMGKAGISIKWVDCPFSTEAADPGSPCGGTLGGTVFLVRITRDHVPNQGRIWDTTLGFTRVTPEGGSVPSTEKGGACGKVKAHCEREFRGRPGYLFDGASLVHRASARRQCSKGMKVLSELTVR